MTGWQTIYGNPKKADMTIIFLHGNGFPPKCYSAFLQLLSLLFSSHEIKTTCIAWVSPPLSEDHRGQHKKLKSWWQLVELLQADILKAGLSGSVVIGHSMGAVLASMCDTISQDLFSSLVLVEPVFINGFQKIVIDAVRTIGASKLLPIVRQAKRRRRLWHSREEAEKAWSSKKIFSNWVDTIFKDYVAAALKPSGEGGELQLVYDPVWEARIYETVPTNWKKWLGRVSKNTLIVRGSDSTVLSRQAAEEAAELIRSADLVELEEAGHFVPMERPLSLAPVIAKWLLEQSKPQAQIRRLSPGEKGSEEV